MSVRRELVFPERIREERQAAKYIARTLVAELQKVADQKSKPLFVQVEFPRITPEGVDIYTPYVLNGLIANLQREGDWIFDSNACTVRLENQNKTVVFTFA